MSQALREFEQTLIYKNTAPATDIVTDLGEIHEIDKSMEKKAKRFGCMGGLLLPASLLSFPLFIGTPPAVWLTWLVLCIGGGITLLVIAFRANKQNVEDRRYELARAIVDLLARDASPDAQFTINLSLRAATRKENFQEKGKAGHWNFKLYHDPWLHLEVKLLDGTHCRIVLTERHQKRHRWKTSASGKSKLKTKVKSALEAAIRLKPKTEKYTKLGEIGADARGAIQLPDWSSPKALAVEEGGLVMKAATKSEWDAPKEGARGTGPHGVHMVAMMLLSLYQILNLSRAITKSEKQQ